ncbi:hypothetical protein H4219_002422 [Mycoemilia scoparia]|uniref:Calcineurin-like phosphoesterase domain-containing protein n=1 Tax=Mycoemilia scoparia TaxID=417184 RepID=A0A9W7ZXJ5_9FUNG|nr:hypothetical protein H4219_002422 [Mycoemilia scoparia]
MARRPRLLTILQVYWVILIIYGELGIFYQEIYRCKSQSIQKVPKLNEVYRRVAIITDPQIVDNYSYGHTGLRLYLEQFFTDLNLRKTFSFMQISTRPDVIVNIGDLMDGGREWSDLDIWSKEYARYRSIFVNRYPESCSMYEMVGNHDIGIGASIVESAASRLKSLIGPSTREIRAGDHLLVLLDTISLESPKQSIRREAEELLNKYKNALPSSPVLLFSHVPLWRPPMTDCGELYQGKKNYLSDIHGYQYHNLLSKNTTEDILQKLQPSMIFSGDDHDTCIVNHHIKNGRLVEEHTVGTLSWAGGVPKTSFVLMNLYKTNGQMASLHDPSATFDVTHCFLPWQLGIYITYIVSLVATFVILTLLSLSQSCHHTSSSPDEDPTTYIPVNDKDDADEVKPKRQQLSGRWSRLAKYLGRSMLKISVYPILSFILCLFITHYF